MLAKVIIIKDCIKDYLNTIKYWSKIDKERHRVNKVEVISESDIEKKVYELEFVVFKSFIGYSDICSIYDLNQNELEKLIINDYKLLKLHNKIPDRIIIIKRILDSGLEIIPLDNEIYIKTDEDLQIHLKDKSIIKTENIVVIDFIDNDL